jgi:hypothetical protein
MNKRKIMYKRLSDDENKMIICGNCDKCYHSFCSKSDFNSSRCEKCMKLCHLCNTQFARDNETICNDCYDCKKNTVNINILILGLFLTLSLNL